MSLTLPSAYSSASKQGNIQENWIVQLGFFNGDAQGSGEGGWDATLQADGTANLLNEALDNSETGVDVDDGTVFQVGDFIKVDSEIMKILSISTHTLTVERDAMNTTAATHNNNTAIYWNNFTPISLADTTVDSVFYHGVITNTPSIRASIDLAKSTAKTGNISLSVINFQFKGDDFSAELFLGTRKYINRNVKIYSQLNGDSTLSNCLQVYQGRLIDISHDDSTIKLTLTEQRPWDFISIPQEKTTGVIIHVPVDYGGFTPNNNTYWGSPLYLSELSQTELRPCPLLFSQDIFNYYVADTSAKTDSRAEYWDKSLGYFIPINDSDNTAITTSIAKNSQFVTKTLKELKRSFKTRPSSHAITATSGATILTDDLDEIYDTDTSTAGTFESDASADRHIIVEFYDTPSPDGDFSQGTIYLKSMWDWASGNNQSKIKISYSLDNSSYSTLWQQTGTSGDRAVTTDNFSVTEFPEKLYIKVEWDIFSGGDDLDGKLYIHDIYYSIEQKARDDQTNNVYIGADGLVNSWDGGAIEHGHEAHRDMLIRFAGYTTTAPENWSALHTDRHINTWKIRWWALEPVELKKVLEQLQYEFGFIFKFRADGTGSVIHVLQTSELSAAQTFKKEDIANLKINNMPFSQLLTKMEINYEKHPAENRYLSSVTSTNSTARTDWDIQTKENISDVNLDMNVGTPNTSGQTDGNADFYSYYDNLFGDIKKIISCDIVNPAVSYNLETGDIIQFSNTAGEMPVEPFGDNWADYYMITDLQRSPGKIKIQAREVG